MYVRGSRQQGCCCAKSGVSLVVSRGSRDMMVVPRLGSVQGQIMHMHTVLNAAHSLATKVHHSLSPGLLAAGTTVAVLSCLRSFFGRLRHPVVVPPLPEFSTSVSRLKTAVVSDLLAVARVSRSPAHRTLDAQPHPTSAIDTFSSLRCSARCSARSKT